MGGSRGGLRRARVAAMVGVAAIVVTTVGAPAGADPRPRAGALDARFGTGGIVRTDYEGAYDGAEAVLVQPDGRVVAAGSWGRDTDGTWSSDFALVRYDRWGRLDPTFGVAGTVATDFFGGYDAVDTVLQQRDGKLVAVGTAFPQSGSDPTFALARYRPDGTLDPTFGAGGTVTTDVGYHDQARSAALLPDGRILVAGYDYAADQDTSDIVLARYRPDGTLDPTFGAGGIAVTALDAPVPAHVQAQDLAVQPDGRILTVGMLAAGDRADVAVARFRSDGSLDRAFGDDGFATVDLSDGFEDAPALSLLPNGRIVVLVTFDGRWGLARLRPDGRPDRSFGADGTVRSDRTGEAFDLLVQDDGRLVVAGRSAVHGEQHIDITLSRFRRNGHVDRAFGTAGVVTTDIAESTDGAAAVTTGPDDTLVIAGSTEPIPPALPYADLLVARYHR